MGINGCSNPNFSHFKRSCGGKRGFEGNFGRIVPPESGGIVTDLGRFLAFWFNFAPSPP